MKDPNDATTKDLVIAQVAQKQLQQVATTYGDNLPYSYDRILNECAFFMEQSAMAAIELGKRLILIKEMEGHGKFGAALSVLGLSQDTAQRMMKAAIKLPNTATSRHLIDAVKTKSKIFELMILDNDELQELSDGGTVAGLKLDDIDRMSVRELRAALRESRDNLQTKDKILTGKNIKLDEMEVKIDTLSRKLAEKDHQKAIERLSPEQEGAKLRNEVVSIVAAIETDGILRQLQQAFVALQMHSIKSNIDHGAFMAGCVNQIKRSLVTIQNDFELYLEDDAPNPYWNSPEAEKAADEAIQELNIDWSVIEGTGRGETNH